MPTKAEVEEFAQANRDLRNFVLAELAGFWAALDLSDARSVRAALEEFVPLLVQQYGEIAATVAADYYDRLRETAGAAGAFSAVLADPVPAEEVRGQARWAITPLFGAVTPAGRQDALGRLAQVVDRAVLQTGRDTIADSTSADPAGARWARVPVGKTCAFCLLLASRGAVYRSRQTAGDARKYHGQCDCTPTPFFRGDPYPDGYDPDALLQQYQTARDEAKSGQMKPILSALRAQTGGH